MISILIVTRNESDYIEECLSSVVSQLSTLKNEGYPEYELIVVDGMSDDGTLSMAKRWCEKHGVVSSFIENPRKTLATGWNLGIRNSQGEFIIRPDAHAKLHPGYITACLRALKRFPNAGVAGGRLETKSKGVAGEIISKVLSSKVGVGNSSFRTSQQAGFRDTAVYGLYRREVFEKVGLFNEQLTRHQDTEFHRRMKDAGYVFYFEPEAVADYYCRKTIGSLSKQYFNIGFFLPDLIWVGHAKAVRPRHMAPAVFYLTSLSLFLSGVFFSPACLLGTAVFSIYLSVLFVESIRIALDSRKLHYLGSFFIFILVHVSYASGTLLGLLKRKK